MRSLLGTTSCLLATLMLNACGGGGNTTVGSSAATCDSNRLWAAHPSASGSAIPDNNSQGIEVRWENQNCDLKSITSARLELCLNHSRPSDLAWSIKHPLNNNPVPILVSNNWSTADETCRFNSGKFQQISLDLGSTTTTRGNWTLQVKDTQLDDTGSLVQWRLIIEGIQ